MNQWTKRAGALAALTVLISGTAACGSSSNNNGGNSNAAANAGNTSATTNDTSTSNSSNTTNNANTSANQPAAEPVKIRFAGWGDPSEKEVFTKLIKSFEEKNPNIKVEYLHIPDDYVGKMNTILAGGDAPDVFYVPDGDFGRWVSQDLLQPIDEYLSTSNIDTSDMWESSLLRYRYDGAVTGKGNLYALPKDIGPTVLYYNKDIFTKMGVPFPSAENPMTFDQLLETAQKLTVKNGDKVTQYGMGPIWWEGFVLGNGGQFLSEDKKEFLLNSKEASDALQFAVDLAHKYNVVPDSRALKAMNDGQMFETGKLAMMIQGRWMVPTYRKLKFDWDVAPLPTNGKWAGWSGSVGLGIYSKSKQKDAAYKLVEYLGGPEGQKEQSLMGFAIPSFKSMASTDVFLQPGQKPEHAEVFIKAAQNEIPGPWTNLPNAKWWDMLNQNLGPMWEAKKPAADLLNELKPKIDAAIKEGNPAIFK
ncbi:carbohydrate ABC transporter substrate-binding protein (CUT1 family) [Paenibacillus taihuensis]|uniref:Carbohydrate ABC transporter substrate-binding protein (CUT1 family) n=1 Tax=Paenibacillus taihuensis TaxID=1156355 RepID=A0A3D9Q727_9BACL|nr:sugar ABC transporter substrate-binding protein [Paenibacillus taihuensis]REE56483.1 carbohydrate ABC transporter substrate-binding protein (CUT1 family) [Paenibacillus taihuensis]